MKDVGIKNYYNIFNLLIIIFFLISLFFTILFWLYFDADVYAESMARYGVEVEAEITDCSFIEKTDDDNSHYDYWQTYYTYVDAEGRKYSGRAYSHSSKAEAESRIGIKVKITINPCSGESSKMPLSYFKKEKDGLHTHFVHACIVSPIFLFFAFELFYRVVYRTNLNKKIVNNIKSGFISRGTVTGEVVKTVGLIWFYVKIKSVDEFGIPHEKWSGDLFTRREATFLREKRFIKITRHKRVYGIIEEMPYDRFKKRSKNEQ